MGKKFNAKTREYFGDYHKNKLHFLYPERINEGMHTDAFFLSIASIKGYRRSQMFYYKHSKLIVMILLQQEFNFMENYSLDLIYNSLI